MGFFKSLKKTMPFGFSPSDKAFDLSGDKAKRAQRKDAALTAATMARAQEAFNSSSPSMVPGMLGGPITPYTGPGAAQFQPQQPPPGLPAMMGQPNGQYGLLAQQMAGMAPPGQITAGPQVPQSATPNRFMGMQETGLGLLGGPGDRGMQLDLNNPQRAQAVGMAPRNRRYF